MCMSSPKMSAPPPPPPEPPPPPKKQDPAVQAARASNRATAALARGRDSTITNVQGGQGLNTPASTTGKKTALGQ